MIGRAYLATLAFIKGNLDQNGKPSNDNLRREPAKGFCQYDRCPNKKQPSKAKIIISDGKSKLAIKFHSSCIDEILQDVRLPNIYDECISRN